jgi:hypothetical protein
MMACNLTLELASLKGWADTGLPANENESLFNILRAEEKSIGIIN